MPNPPVKRGNTLELSIEKFADRGKSLTRLNGLVVFVAGAVPGDRIIARVTRVKKNYAEAVVEDLIEPSELRTEPRCRYFGTCGGCRWQHVAYRAQLEAKRRSVREAFEHRGGFDELEVPEVVGAEEIYLYRNKMEFSFSAQRWLTPDEIATGKDFDTNFALGLHVPGNFSKVVDLEECHLQSDLSVRIVNAFRALAKQHEWSAWHARRKEGYLRHLVIRQSERCSETMVNVVTSERSHKRVRTMAQMISRDFPEVTTFLETVNQGAAQTAYGDTQVITGPGVIHDRIGNYVFEISPATFFQTNTPQAERLYEAVSRMAAIHPDDRVYDLYCGAGTIALFVSSDAAEVVGIELVEEAVESARRNAALNGVDNCSFYVGDMRDAFTRKFVQEHGSPDVLIVDPPRAGLHPRVVKRIGSMLPPRIVYVSCNPQTQARDIGMLRERYRLEHLQPVDLFPHTYHIENVALLTAT